MAKRPLANKAAAQPLDLSHDLFACPVAVRRCLGTSGYELLGQLQAMDVTAGKTDELMVGNQDAPARWVALIARTQGRRMFGGDAIPRSLDCQCTCRPKIVRILP